MSFTDGVDPECPCKNCKERKPKCHSDCQKYLKYKDILDVEREKKRNSYKTSYMFNCYIRKNYRKYH